MRGCVDHTSLATDSIVRHTADTFKLIMRRLSFAGRNASPGDISELEIVHGVRYVPDGLLFAAAIGITPLNQMYSIIDSAASIRYAICPRTCNNVEMVLRPDECNS